MNPDPSLESVRLPHDLDSSSVEESWKPFMEKMARIESQEMQRLASDVHKQARTICWTKEEYAASEHGMANAHAGLLKSMIIRILVKNQDGGQILLLLESSDLWLG